MHTGFWWKDLSRERRPGRHRHRWEANTKMDPQEMVWRGKGCIDLAQNRDRWRAFVNAVMNLEVCHPRCVCVCVCVCVCENWKGYVVKHNYVN